MELKSALKKLFPGLIAVGLGLAISPEKAQAGPYYYCEKETTPYPSTMVMHSGVPDVFISWQSNYGMSAGYSPPKRCQIVSNKLQQNIATMKYMAPGVAYLPGQPGNGLPVICASQTAPGEPIQCPDEKILWTLSNRNYNDVIRKIANLNTNASEQELIQSSAIEQANGYMSIRVSIMQTKLRPVPQTRPRSVPQSPRPSEPKCEGVLGICNQ